MAQAPSPPAALAALGRDVVLWLATLYAKALRKGAAVPDSTATTVAGIVADHNALLAKLRSAGLIDP